MNLTDSPRLNVQHSNREEDGTVPQFTATEQRILQVLADGRPHKPHELTACIGDSQASEQNMRMHLSNIRKKTRPIGQDILCEIWNRTMHYRHVRYLAGSYGE